MAIKKETLTKLETSLGLKEGDFAAMYEDKEEKDIDLTNIEIAKKDELTQRIENIGKTKFDEGKEAGRDIFIKEVRGEFGLDDKALPKKADSKVFKTAVEGKVLMDNKVEPNAKIKELEADKATLAQKNQDWEQKYTGLQKETVFKEKTNDVKFAILAKAPDNLVISKEDALLLGFQKECIKVAVDEDRVVFKKNGVVMKNDKTLNPMTADEIAPMIFSPYVKTPEGPAAKEKDKPGQAKTGTLAEFKERMIKEGLTPGSEQYMIRLRKEFPGGKIPS